MNVLRRIVEFNKASIGISALGKAALIAASLAVCGFSTPTTQAGNANGGLQQYVGTWQAKLKDETYLTIKLAMQQGKLTGTTNRVDTQINGDGEVTSATQLDGSEAIVEAKLTNGSLRITTEDEDTVQLEIKLTGTDQAELRMVNPSDVPLAKPLKLERTKSQ